MRTQSLRWTLYAAATTPVGLLATGCSNPTEKAERRFEMVKQHGDPDEICAEARRRAEVWLDAGDQYEYDMKKVEADLVCISARIKKLER